MAANEKHIRIYETMSPSLIQEYKAQLCLILTNEHITNTERIDFRVNENGSFEFKTATGYTTLQDTGSLAKDKNVVSEALTAFFQNTNEIIKRLSTVKNYDKSFEIPFFPVSNLKLNTINLVNNENNNPHYWSCNYQIEVPAYEIVETKDNEVVSRKPIKCNVANASLQVDVSIRGNIIGMQYNLLPFKPKWTVPLYPILTNEGEMPQINYLLNSQTANITPFYLSAGDVAYVPASKESVLTKKENEISTAPSESPSNQNGGVTISIDNDGNFYAIIKSTIYIYSDQESYKEPEDLLLFAEKFATSLQYQINDEKTHTVKAFFPKKLEGDKRLKEIKTYGQIIDATLKTIVVVKPISCAEAKEKIEAQKKKSNQDKSVKYLYVYDEKVLNDIGANRITGGNSGYLNMNNIPKAWLHEYFHLLGWSRFDLDKTIYYKEMSKEDGSLDFDWSHTFEEEKKDSIMFMDKKTGSWNPNSAISDYDLSRLNYGDPLQDGKTLGEIDSFDFYTYEIMKEDNK